MGLEYAFDSIYTISSGFSNAASFLSGDGRKNISVYYEDLCEGSFLKPHRFWKMLDLNYLVEVLTKRKPINVNNLLNQKTKLFVRLKCKGKKQEEYLEIHDFSKANFFNLIKAASAVPFLSPGYIRIGKHSYKDPIWTDSQTSAHLKHVLATPATDIFVIYNHYLQYAYIQKHVKPFRNKRIFHLYPKKSSALSRLENRPHVLIKAAEEMGRMVKKVFGLKSGIKLFKTSPNSYGN
jgi:predicted patatin/cPLA2 family phospholipase